MDEKELKMLAAQLSCPTGEVGVEVGNTMNELNQFITDKTIEKLAAKQGESIVEIGPGNGSLSTPILQSIAEGGRYLGIEMSQTMAEESRRVLGNYGADIEIVCEDCLAVDVEPGSVDAILAVNVLYFIDDLAAFLNRAASWLTHGGRVVFGVRSDTVLNSLPFTQYGFNVRSIDEITLLMKGAGFVTVESTVYDEGVVNPFEDTEIAVDSVIISGKVP